MRTKNSKKKCYKALLAYATLFTIPEMLKFSATP